MTTEQKTVKIFAIILASVICLSILSAIIKGLGFLLSWVDDDYSKTYITEEVPTSDFDIREIDRLTIDIKVANLEVRVGTSFKIEKSDIQGALKVRQSGSTLKIEEQSNHFWNVKQSGSITITLPSSINLEKFTVDQGAGTVILDGIKAENFDFDQGAGTLTIDNCTFDHTDIDGGVGKMTVRASTFKDLDLDAGVGTIDLEARLLGKTDIDGGVGSLNLNILGEKEDYSFRIEKGLGSITVDGVAQSGSFGNGSNRIEIDGGVGSIKVDFN